MMEDPRNITQCTHLLFCTKSLERVGDHATNIAEAAYYLETGRQLSAQDRRAAPRPRSGARDHAMTATHPDRRRRSRPRELMRYNLEAEGFRVATAASGDEAVERIRDGVPDLILLDWMLPGLSGIELCRRWRCARRDRARRRSS